MYAYKHRDAASSSTVIIIIIVVVVSKKAGQAWMGTSIFLLLILAQ
jgi:hypothetical protein